jgi:hypothetical protein
MPFITDTSVVHIIGMSIQLSMDNSKIILLSYRINIFSRIDAKHLVNDTPPIQKPMCLSERIL